MNTFKIYTFLLIFFGIFLATQNLSAQRMQDVIYLDNGSKIRGTILEKQDDKVKIQLSGGTELVFEMEEVKEITSEPFFKPKAQFVVKEKGYYNVTELGYMVGNDNGWIASGGSIVTINGYQLSSRLGLGIGIELANYFDNLFVPIFLDVRGDVLKNSKTTPFYYGGVGYGLLVTGRDDFGWQERGGLYYNYGIGIKVRGKRHASWIFNIGQQTQNYESIWTIQGNDWNTGDRTEITNVWFNRIVIKSGVYF